MVGVDKFVVDSLILAGRKIGIGFSVGLLNNASSKGIGSYFSPAPNVAYLMR